jgi:hypothetical protein
MATMSVRTRESRQSCSDALLRLYVRLIAHFLSVRAHTCTCGIKLHQIPPHCSVNSCCTYILHLQYSPDNINPRSVERTKTSQRTEQQVVSDSRQIEVVSVIRLTECLLNFHACRSCMYRLGFCLSKRRIDRNWLAIPLGDLLLKVKY